MGSLNPGTLCVYCGVREAGYIPDGCVGPLCFAPKDVCCYDQAVIHGWSFVQRLRYERFKAAIFGRLARRRMGILGDPDIVQMTTEFLVDA